MLPSPLPKTKAPAKTKKVRMVHKVPPAVPPRARRAAKGRGERLVTPVFPLPQDFQNARGGVLTSQARTPAARESSTCSVWERLVTAAVPSELPQSRGARQRVLPV